MKKDTIKIDLEIYIVFIVLIGVSVFNAIYSTAIISQNQEASTHIMTVDVPSMQALENMNLLVTRSKMYTTNWAHLQNDREDKRRLIALHQIEYPELKKKLSALMTLWKDQRNHDSLQKVFNNFDELIILEKNIMGMLVKFDDYEDPMKRFGAEEILENQVLPKSAMIMTMLDHVILNRKLIADVSHNKMTASSRTLMWSVLGLALMVVIIVLLAGFYFSNSIIVPVMKLRNYILQMSKGELPEIKVVTNQNAIGQMTKAVQCLGENLQRTAQFANRIGDGDFKAQFQPLSENDELGNALIQMRDNLRNANEELSDQSKLLQTSREELKKSNHELKIKAGMLQSQNERLEQAREALSIKAKELEKNNKFKSEFLANMSHELRTPLNSVLILAKLLSDNKNNALGEKEIEYARVIHKSGSNLLALINDILDLSKIESGKIELVMQTTAIRQIKENMLDLFSPVANEKKIEFQTEIHSDLPEEFITDPFRLEQVIKNLLSNAMKFTGAGGKVVFRIKQADRKRPFNSNALLEAKSIIEFSVEDTGIGIAKEKQPLIFEAFQQADGSTSRKYGGTGLGLSISKMLTTMLGGEIEVESFPGKESIFYLFLPLNTLSQGVTTDHGESICQGRTLEAYTKAVKKSKMEQLIVIPNQGNKITQYEKVILIVDDDMRNVYALSSMLASKNINVINAASGTEALQKLSAKSAHLVLIDVMNPGINGYETIEAIRRNSAWKSLPVIAIADTSMNGIRKRCMESGATDYICNPFVPEQLENLMESFLKSNTEFVK